MIAFDFDGTLVSPAHKQVFCLKAVARRYGRDIDTIACWTSKQMGQPNVEFLVQQGISRTLAEKISTAWRNLVETPYWSTYDTLFPDVLPCLAALKRTRKRAMILSARQNPHWLDQQLTRLQLHDYFDAVACVSPQEAAAAKSRILQNHPISLFIGDTESDFDAAQRAHVAFRAVATGQRTVQFLRACGVSNIYTSLSAALATVMEEE